MIDLYVIIKNMRFAILSLFAVFILNLIGMYFDWYKFFWFDNVLHYSGGFFVALLFFHYLRPHFLPKARLQNILILVGSVMLIGVVWEFAEYLGNQLLTEPVYASFGVKIEFMGNMADTVTDLLMDMFGGLTLAGLLLRNHKIKIPLSR